MNRRMTFVIRKWLSQTLIAEIPQASLKHGITSSGFSLNEIWTEEYEDIVAASFPEASGAQLVRSSVRPRRFDLQQHKTCEVVIPSYMKLSNFQKHDKNTLEKVLVSTNSMFDLGNAKSPIDYKLEVKKSARYAPKSAIVFRLRSLFLVLDPQVDSTLK